VRAAVDWENLQTMLSSAETPWKPQGAGWFDSAVCRNLEQWRPRRYRPGFDVADTRRRLLWDEGCSKCPVRSDCLTSALAVPGGGTGIYAGTLPDDRVQHRLGLELFARLDA